MAKHKNLSETTIGNWTHAVRLEFIKLSDSNKLTIYDTCRAKIQSPLYTIEDCQSVVDSYKELPDFDANNAGYLKIYGLLQALYVQQDALSNLNKVTFNIAIDYKTKQELLAIRNIRNKTIGHPSSSGGEYFTIFKTTLKKSGYTLMVHNKDDKTALLSINISKLISDQEMFLFPLMKKYLLELKNYSSNY